MQYIVATEEERKFLNEKAGVADENIFILGIGAVNLLQSLAALESQGKITKETPLVNLGYVGSNHLPLGQKLVIKRAMTHHVTASFMEHAVSLPTDDAAVKEALAELFGEEAADVAVVDCYSSTDFVMETPIEEPCAFDMELAFIAAAGYNVRAIKIVSDNLDKDEYFDAVGKYVGEDMREDATLKRD